MSASIWRTIVIFIVLALSFVCRVNASGTTFLWFCNAAQLCQKAFAPQTLPTAPEDEYTSQKVCKLTCGNYASLWPKPTIKTRLSKNLIEFHPSTMNFECDITDEEYLVYLAAIKDIFKANINRECGKCSKKNSKKVSIQVSSHTTNVDLYYGVDESYTLKITTFGDEIIVKILSKTIYGVRNALETFSQLIVSNRLSPNQQDNEIMLVTVDNATITDRPVYLYRGLLIDTARNYLNMKAIKRQIDAMAHSKLNVLHWHATDSQSFPLKLPTVPILATYGAYSEDKIYTEEDIADLLLYAKYRGVRIIPEIDAPSHAGNGWQWGPKAGLGDLAVCVNKSPWRNYCIQPPCGQLNPVNNNVYTILGQLYGDLLNLFPKNEMFHMGGDEVFIKCWNSSVEIVNYLKSNGRDVTENDYLWLWGQFQDKILAMYDKKAGNDTTNFIVWSSALTDPEIIEDFLNKDRYIIQTWVGANSNLPSQLLDLGYRLIVSTKNAWYLDHGFWGTTQYYPWRVVYKNELLRHPGILGGEVCMWGELVDDNSIDSRVWPRAAAAAERLWSDPDDSSASAEPRFYEHRNRLVSRGIKAEALTPTWCTQNDGQCL